MLYLLFYLIKFIQTFQILIKQNYCLFKGYYTIKSEKSMTTLLLLFIGRLSSVDWLNSIIIIIEIFHLY